MSTPEDVESQYFVPRLELEERVKYRDMLSELHFKSVDDPRMSS